MARRKKHIVMCADDFGMNEHVNRAVLELAAARRLSATSCLTQGAAWPSGAGRLRALDIDVGLHINFTEALDSDNHFHRPLSRLMLNAWLRHLDVAMLVRTIERQCDAFEQHMLREPDFFDGHQHVHQFPQIRDALVEVLVRRYDCDDVWVRSTAMRHASLKSGLQLKARLIALLGSAALCRRLRHAGFPFNADFAGVYDFTGGAARFARNMDGWLTAVEDGALIMCHPAQASDPHDTLGEQRVAEYGFLKGEAFGALLRRHDCRVIRMQT